LQQGQLLPQQPQLVVEGLVFEQHGIEVGGHSATTGPMHPAPALTPHALPSALSTARILAATMDFRSAGSPSALDGEPPTESAGRGGLTTTALKCWISVLHLVLHLVLHFSATEIVTTGDA
jgi:hypothetical protein